MATSHFTSKKIDVPGLTSLGRGFQSATPGTCAGVEERVTKYTGHYDGEAEADSQTKQRSENAAEISTSYYNLVTDFFEYGYGQSFHFAPVMDELTFDECLAEYERGIAKTLGIEAGGKILDVGCGVGGPGREVAKFSSAHVVGLNVCDYQLSRARIHTEKAGMTDVCSYVKGDFCNMEFADNTFDGVFALEATCHARDPVTVYKEIFRVLKPGALFVETAWAMTDNYDPQNAEHVKIKNGILIGNGLPDLKLQPEILEAIRKAGFEVVEFKNGHRSGDLPWYTFLQGKGYCSLQNFRVSPFGRFTTHIILAFLETIRVAPKGSTKVHTVLQTAAWALIAAGKLDIFTPTFRIVARKPL